jgi:adenylate cyclase
MAESMSAGEFSEVLNRFYNVATTALIRTDAYIDKFVGDEVMAVYLPLFAGSNPALQAVRAAADLLRTTGHADDDGPWLPVGIGVHTGPAFFGTVTGTDGVFSDFTALGDTVNVAARLVGAAQQGEALISEATFVAAGIEGGALEQRDLSVKGKSEPIGVRVMSLTPGLDSSSLLDAVKSAVTSTPRELAD